MRKILLFITFFTVYFAYSQNLILWSESAISIDFKTEQILYQKNKDLIIPPASMTKLITLYMAYMEIEKGNVKKSDFVNISPRADYKNLPRDSSLMFIEEGQKVSLLELMKGLAIPSGNDAAIAVAEHLFGSVEIYLIEVNKEMKRLGLNNLKFVDSSGFDDDNQITVGDFAQFCIILLKKYPEIKNELFYLESFTYPTKENGLSSIGSIKQYNHNKLIGIYPDCEGLKTGFINKSGMNISLTATREGRQIIGVLAGVKDKDKNTAELKRFYDSITLLNYSFDSFYFTYLDKISLPVIKNNNKNIEAFIPYKREILYSKNTSIYFDLNNPIINFNKMDFLGFVYFDDGINKSKYPIYVK